MLLLARSVAVAAMHLNLIGRLARSAGKVGLASTMFHEDIDSSLAYTRVSAPGLFTVIAKTRGL